MLWSVQIDSRLGKSVITISGIENLGESGTFAISGRKLEIDRESLYGDLLDNETASPNDWIWWCLSKGYYYKILEGEDIPDEPDLDGDRNY